MAVHWQPTRFCPHVSGAPRAAEFRRDRRQSSREAWPLAEPRAQALPGLQWVEIELSAEEEDASSVIGSSQAQVIPRHVQRAPAKPQIVDNAF